jgi:4-amino-4-deoxy-L-arabinose transferase-like glycosyltransferase
MPPTANTLRRIFFGALAIRWVYDVALFAAMGKTGLMGADSRGYLGDAEIMAAQLMHGDLHGWAWLGSDVGRMPIYPWLVTLNVLVFGSLAPITTVLVQGVVDSGTCLLVHRIAKSIDSRIALPAAIAAAINPTQIVLSGIVYTDTLFAFFIALFLAGAASWLRKPAWPAALSVGIGLGLAALVRIVVAPWVPVMIVVLLVAARLVGRLRVPQVGQVAAMAAIFALAIGPILARNVDEYGAWTLTSQGGSHLALWVAPLVREAKDGTPWERGTAAMEQRARQRFGPSVANPFTESSRYAALGREELVRLGPAAVIKAWAIGAAINLASPAIIISPPIAQLPRIGFYATKGGTMFEKIGNFLFHSDNAAYAWALLLGVAGVALVRLIQLCGAFAVVRDRQVWPIVVLLALWCGFILAANGPVASPKYRLPMEPVLCVLTGAGYALLRGRRAQASA